MKVKRLLPLFFALLLILILTVGGGFAVFYFGNENGNKEQTVDVVAEEMANLGSVTILDGENRRYQIFFDTDSVYLFRSDNPTKDAIFSLECDFSDSDLPQGYTAALVCDVTISDRDDRGYLRNAEKNFVYSTSAVDYFQPVNAVFEEASKPGSPFVLTENDEKGDKTSLTYRSILFDGIEVSPNRKFTTGKFELKFEYKEYSLTENGSNHHGSMSPQAQYTDPDGFAKIMTAARTAKENAEIKIAFRLILQKEGE